MYATVIDNVARPIPRFMSLVSGV